jgi:hypothetical protein
VRKSNSSLLVVVVTVEAIFYLVIINIPSSRIFGYLIDEAESDQDLMIVDNPGVPNQSG